LVGDAVVDLVIGSNNMDTTFSGVIEAFNHNTSLHKVGRGTLTLSGDVTFSGDIDIHRGVLQVDGSFATGNTFVFRQATLAGTGTIRNNVDVQDGGTVRPGSAGAPGGLTVRGSYAQSGDSATLIIQIASDTEFSTLDVISRQTMTNLNGPLAVERLNDFMPAPGETFDFLFYNLRVGEFTRIENRNFGDMHWEVCYDDDSQFKKAFLMAVAGPGPGCP
jgi:fibronectin-binding autotransporter adhesin